MGPAGSGSANGPGCDAQPASPATRRVTSGASARMGPPESCRLIYFLAHRLAFAALLCLAPRQHKMCKQALDLDALVGALDHSELDLAHLVDELDLQAVGDGE